MKNRQTVAGYLGKDPESKTVGDTTVTTVSIAVGEKWKDKNGKTQEKTEWFEFNFWGARGEALAKFFKKGDGILAEGKTETRTYEDKDGVKQYRRSVRGDDWDFPPGSKKKEEHPDTTGRSFDDGPPAGGGGDDIPF
jgi:single-strand DNA-binding protein